MTELQKYLAEEVAEDHVDGIITRREAMRRLGAARGRRGDGVDDAGGRGARRKGGDHGHGMATATATADGRATAWAPVATRGDHVRRPATAR